VVFRCSLFLLLIALLVPAYSFAAGGHANAFIYHRFGDDRYPSTDISAEDFAAQLRWLKKEGRPVLSLGEVVRRLRAGEALPEGCVVLTVDDAFRSFFETGMPLLRRYGFPVTLFVNTAAVGSPGYLDWAELKRLAGEGVEIGNHSRSHAYLLNRREGESTEDWRRRVRGDITAAQQELARELGRAPTLFAYPYGEFSPELQKIVAGLGFYAAVAQQSGVISPASDLFALPRFPMGGAYATLEGFRAKAAMKPLPVRVLAPDTPVLAAPGPPPVLRVAIDTRFIRADELKCFVQGRNSCRVVAEPGGEGEFTAVAEHALAGRRNKYTLTAPGRRGGWYWFSQPWFLPGPSAGGDY
jgi:peptidoglycan/xylan/chitin deacetylase (PgdA/CDA1 family)